jgi:hypothetical protein
MGKRHLSGIFDVAEGPYALRAYKKSTARLCVVSSLAVLPKIDSALVPMLLTVAATNSKISGNMMA